ncbi:LysR family transcriptional regulator [Roseovarius sp. SCSIO 43702]|uniref:LysR family transcriptional regulator n=1 Tax=Roseovarius sp. SCSIO 43702 TaxID=2823043 RepID=UPI001C737B3A|nr:LysR family transcriptional regulator [Roseovarius sp. SCSIO 43702]QYX58370.1 LysR family transcriptional regulator [Roseovarius sp. SCSIO 43702]
MDSDNQYFKSLTLRQMAYAVAAADHGNVTRAAQRLNVSQPAISAAIAALEAHYGARLFSRAAGQGVTLTPFGMRAVAEMRLMCDGARRVAGLGRTDGAIAGEVSLCCYDAIAPHVLPPILRRIEARLPGVSVRFLEVDLDGAVGALTRGQADLAITYDLGLGEGHEARTLYAVQPVVICGAGHPLAARAAPSLADLDGERMILLDQPLSAQYVIGLLRARGAVPRIVAQVRGPELQRALVAQGFGVALVHTPPPEGAVYGGEALVSVALADELVPQRVLVACRAESARRPILAAVREEMVAAFREDAAG